MESIDTQSDLAMIDNIEFEEKVDIETLVLMAEPTKVPRIEFADKENELLVGSIHEERKNFDLKMEENIFDLFEELDKEKSEISMIDFSRRRSLKIKQFVERIRKYDTLTNQMASKVVSFNKKIVEITEEHKITMSLNAKTMNTIVKIHEKALDEKTNELAQIKQELQSVNVTIKELLQKIQELETNNNVCLERNDEVKPFLCKYCHESFVQVHEVREHIKIHESILEDTDDITFKNHDKEVNTNAPVNTVKKRKLMKTHKKHRHEQKNEGGKQIESESTSGEKSPEKFNKVKHGYPCQVCGVSFTRKPALKTHIETIHEGKRPHKCTFCEESFSVKSNMTRHINSVHMTNKPLPFSCKNCIKGFKRSDHLKIHEESCE